MRKRYDSNLKLMKKFDLATPQKQKPNMKNNINSNHMKKTTTTTTTTKTKTTTTTAKRRKSL